MNCGIRKGGVAVALCLAAILAIVPPRLSKADELDDAQLGVEQAQQEVYTASDDIETILEEIEATQDAIALIEGKIPALREDCSGAVRARYKIDRSGIGWLLDAILSCRSMDEAVDLVVSHQHMMDELNARMEALVAKEDELSVARAELDERLAEAQMTLEEANAELAARQDEVAEIERRREEEAAAEAARRAQEEAAAAEAARQAEETAAQEQASENGTTEAESTEEAKDAESGENGSSPTATSSSNVSGGGGVTLPQWSDQVIDGLPNPSSQLAYQRIANMESSTSYLVAIDYDRNYMHVFKGSAGSWELVRSFMVITGKNRYFGNERYRNGNCATPIGVFHLSGKNSVVNTGTPVASFCAAFTHGANVGNTDYIHAYIDPPITDGVDPNTYGEDMVAYWLGKGKYHAGSGGCVMLMREDAIWFYYNAATKGTTCYVWTERPATSSDGYESDALRNVMISNGYCDVSELRGDERSLTSPNQ